MMISQLIQTSIKYDEFYVYIPKVGIRIKPYQLWDPSHISLFRASNWILVLGVVLLLAVHLEEILVSSDGSFISTYAHLRRRQVLGLPHSNHQVSTHAAMVPIHLLQTVVRRCRHLRRDLFWRCGDRDRGVDSGEYTSRGSERTSDGMPQMEVNIFVAGSLLSLMYVDSRFLG